MTTTDTTKIQLIHLGNPIQEITPERAASWITNNMYVRQRNHREHHVDEIAQAMRDDRFLEGTAITFGVLDGQLHLVNGQHTLRAIVKNGKPYTLSVQHYAVDNEDSLAILYSRHDCHLGRTNSDNAAAYNLAERFDMASSNVSRFNAGVKMLLNGFEEGSTRLRAAPGTRSFEASVESMEDWLAEGKTFFNEILVGDVQRAHRQVFLRASVVAIALLTLRYHPEMARRFWTSTIQDDGLRKGDPQKALLTYLRENKSKHNEDARYIAIAWNAYFRGDEAQVLRMPLVNDIKVAGTPVVMRNIKAAKAKKASKPVAAQAVAQAEVKLTPKSARARTPVECRQDIAARLRADEIFEFKK